MTEGPVQWLQRQARDRAHAVALVAPNDEGISFQAFHDRVVAEAEPIRCEGEGRLVTAQASVLDLATLLFAAPLAGCALLPLDPNMPAEIRQAFDSMAASPTSFSPLPPEPEAVHLVIATSGTTGVPKGVMLTGGNLTASAQASRQRIGLEPGDRWLVCLPLFHIGGLSILTRCMEAGATAVLQEGFREEAVINALLAGEITHLSLVPTMLMRLLDAWGDRSPPRSLKCILVGGAALSAPLARRALEAGWPLAPTYGMSETASQCATLPTMPSNWREGQVGMLLDGFEASLQGDRLKLRGPGVMAGYLTADRNPGEGLLDGWFVTNDLVQFGPDGSLEVLGRADDILISGGENVHPAAVESVLAECDGVEEVAVAGIKDERWGDCLVALYVGSVSAERVVGDAAPKLKGAYKPKRIIEVPALPRNSLGKLDRVVLRELAKEKATLL